MKKLVSIIVPIYNVQQYLEECLESIVAQTYKNIEVILVDDGSTDLCPTICDKYATKDPRIKVIHKKNEGLYAARKDGISVATGEYVGFVDADDYIELDMYEMLLQYAELYNVDVVGSGVIDSSKKDRHRFPYFEEGLYKDSRFISDILPCMIFTGDFFQSGINEYLCNKLFRKECIVRHQSREVNPGQEILNDTIVSWPSIICSKSLYITHGCYYHYRVRHNSKKRTKIHDELGTIRYYFDYWLSILTEGLDEKLRAEVERQYKWFIIYRLFSKQPEIFDRLPSKKLLMAYGGISIDARVIVYGAGMVGIQLMRYLKEVPEISVVAWMDRDWESYDESFCVISPNEINNYEFDFIIVAIARSEAIKSAVYDLQLYGVPREMIRTVDVVLLETYFDSFDSIILEGCT